MPNHIIHKQEVILNVESIDNAFNYQNTVSKLFANGLTVAIEELLDEVDTPGTVTRIEKLNLNLGEISAADFASGFKDKLIQQLKLSLGSLHNESISDVSVTKKAQSVREGFIYFIEKGILPWYIEAKDMAAFETVIFNEWIEKDWHLFIDWLRENVKNNPVIAERISLQCSQRLMRQIVAAATYKNIEDNQWQLLLNDLKFIYNKLDVSNTSEKPVNYIIEMFELLFEQDKYFTLDELIAAQLHKLFLKSNEAIILNQLSALENSAQTKALTTIIENVAVLYKKQVSLLHISPKELLRTDKSWLTGFEKSELKNNEEKNLIDDEDYSQKQEGKEAGKSSEKIKKDKVDITEDALFVDNCGVILLHPFLLSYFESLQLIEKKKFVSDEAQKRAIILLYYLCTGLTEVAEFNLVLQKILCGFDMEETLPSGIILSQQEIDESKELLQSVINYWPPVKNTSVEGLQQTFLQRKGKLVTTDTGWQLTVEQKTVDVLLNKLPWGFSTVKLPWMKGFLNVEWC
ncbi:contractile injection system tape measure protein [Parafilimonas terrae]|uniref:Uncharacterized protein n=1 Tax=Parafilimonas terrae TaxID=1465490 RepID=A0A1I5YQ35_9BACT|nr:contractile injection system tape measure protein [Parafilimonas terrae]SFQ46323.1 hypothetical protein SAMN05444277_113104 [Parafilimonas terrae]